MSRIILFNKPFGVLSQFRAADGRRGLGDYLDMPGVYAAGRLDADSEGLLLLTDDGRLQHRLTDPRHKLPKTYLVQVEGVPDAVALKQLRTGVYILDFYDVLIFPFLLPAIQRSMSLSLTEVGSLQALTLFGSAIGGALFGVIGHRFGRKTSLQLTIALFSVAAIVSAFAWNYWSLAALRLITGIGLGGEYGVGMVLFNEVWKKGSRGLGAAALQGCAVIASSTASIVGIWLIATFSDEWSWRIGLLSGGVPILLIIFIRFFMPESKIQYWLSAWTRSSFGIPNSTGSRRQASSPCFLWGYH